MQYDENAEKYGYEGEMTPLKCDELNAYKGDVYIPVYGSIADAQVYLKSEADKVIEDLEEKLKNSRNARKYWMKEYLLEHKECIHHKYKRCLEMAELCNEKWLVHNFEKIPTKLGFYGKWHKRWLELAEKFKGGR